MERERERARESEREREREIFIRLNIIICEISISALVTTKACTVISATTNSGKVNSIKRNGEIKKLLLLLKAGTASF